MGLKKQGLHPRQTPGKINLSVSFIIDSFTDVGIEILTNDNNNIFAIVQSTS